MEISNFHNIDFKKRRTIRINAKFRLIFDLFFIIISQFLIFKGQIYWTDTTGGSIYRSNYDGTKLETFLSSKDGLKFPEGIAIDWISRNVYWADSGKRTIEVANIDTKGKKVLIDEQIKNPRGIAVHPRYGFT